MKVRIDFTATSSDSCTAEVLIDNPVLTELLKEYDQEFSLEDCYDGACLRTERGRVWSIALRATIAGAPGMIRCRAAFPRCLTASWRS